MNYRQEKGNIKMKTMSRKQFVGLFNQIKIAWGFNEDIIVTFPSRKALDMSGAWAVAYIKERYKIKTHVLFVNGILLQYPLEHIIDVIEHELIHFITGRRDNDFIFELTCKMNDIPINEEE
jgi:hypothetical protein